MQEFSEREAAAQTLRGNKQRIKPVELHAYPNCSKMGWKLPVFPSLSGKEKLVWMFFQAKVSKRMQGGFSLNT